MMLIRPRPFYQYHPFYLIPPLVGIYREMYNVFGVTPHIETGDVARPMLSVLYMVVHGLPIYKFVAVLLLLFVTGVSN
jgi:hypothetical protein